MFIYILSRLSLPDQIISTKKNIHVFGNIGSQLGIVVKCFQSERSSVQSLQSPHPTHHIFNFTTFPIGHTPTITQKIHMLTDKTTHNTNDPCQCHQNAPSPSEAKPLKPPPVERFNKKTAKTLKNRPSHHIQPQRQTSEPQHSQFPLRRLKSMLPPHNSLLQLPVPNIALFSKSPLHMSSRMPRNT